MKWQFVKEGYLYMIDNHDTCNAPINLFAVCFYFMRLPGKLKRFMNGKCNAWCSRFQKVSFERVQYEIVDRSFKKNIDMTNLIGQTGPFGSNGSVCQTGRVGN